MLHRYDFLWFERMRFVLKRAAMWTKRPQTDLQLPGELHVVVVHEDVGHQFLDLGAEGRRPLHHGRLHQGLQQRVPTPGPVPHLRSHDTRVSARLNGGRAGMFRRGSSQGARFIFSQGAQISANEVKTSTTSNYT